MIDKWEHINLSKILRRSDIKENPVYTNEYKQLGIRLWGKGAYARETINGGSTGYKFFNKLKSGDVVLNKIWARNGAVTVISNDFENYYVSTEFPVFHLNREIVNPHWMLFATQQKWFWDACEEQSYGTSGKNRIKPEKFLKIKIPLPPLSEQKRIVAKIESVKSKIETIREIRAEQEKEWENLLFSIYEDFEIEFGNISLKKILISSKKWEQPIVGKSYRQMGIRVWGVGGYERETIDGGETKYPKFMKVEKDDLVFNKIWVRNGAITVVSEDLDGCYVSTEFPTFKYNQSTLNSKWLEFLIKQKKFWNKCSEKSFGTSGKNRIKPKEFLEVEIPLPPMETQNEIVSLLDKMEIIKRNYQQQETELTELLPSLLDKAFKGEL